MAFRNVIENRQEDNKLIFCYIYCYTLLILKSSVLFRQNDFYLYLHIRKTIGIVKTFDFQFIDWYNRKFCDFHNTVSGELGREEGIQNTISNTTQNQWTLLMFP